MSSIDEVAMNILWDYEGTYQQDGLLQDTVLEDNVQVPSATTGLSSSSSLSPLSSSLAAVPANHPINEGLNAGNGIPSVAPNEDIGTLGLSSTQREESYQIQQQEEGEGNEVRSNQQQVDRQQHVEGQQQQPYQQQQQQNVVHYPIQKFSNGIVIAKLFHDPETGQPRPFEGIVQRYEFCVDSQKWMYLIYYPEDGDIEHMTEEQLELHLSSTTPTTTTAANIPQQEDQHHQPGQGDTKKRPSLSKKRGKKKKRKEAVDVD